MLRAAREEGAMPDRILNVKGEAAAVLELGGGLWSCQGLGQREEAWAVQPPQGSHSPPKAAVKTYSGNLRTEPSRSDATCITQPVVRLGLIRAKNRDPEHPPVRGTYVFAIK